MDEGSYKPDATLKRIRDISEESLKIAHELNLLKTKEEAEREQAEEDLKDD